MPDETQPPLPYFLPGVATIPSPWCPYFPLCPKRGRAMVGPWVSMGPNVRNRQVVCLECRCRGEQSENLTPDRGAT